MNPPANAGDVGSDLWITKIPWRREWQPTAVSLPEFMDRGARRATVRGGHRVRCCQETERVAQAFGLKLPLMSSVTSSPLLPVCLRSGVWDETQTMPVMGGWVQAPVPLRGGSWSSVCQVGGYRPAGRPRKGDAWMWLPPGASHGLPQAMMSSTCSLGATESRHTDPDEPPHPPKMPGAAPAVAKEMQGFHNPGGPRPGLRARRHGHREGHTVGRAARLGACPEPGVRCSPSPHFATFAVFNHTCPHAPAGTTTEASVFGRGLAWSLLVGFRLRAAPPASPLPSSPQGIWD